MKRIVFDIGGTNIKYGLYEKGQVEAVRELPTQAHLGGQAIMKKLEDLIGENMGPDIDSIGISTAGQVDSRTGRIVYANDNIPAYTGTEIKKVLEARFGLPTYVENDANCAGLGEASLSGLRDMVFITFGTGIGGAVIIDGKLVVGSHFFGGGLGQVWFYHEKTKTYTDFEKIASTSYLVKSAHQINDQIQNGRQVFTYLDNSAILDLLEEWTDNIVIGLINISYILDPQALVLGGGIMENDLIFHKLKQKFSEKSLLKTQIRPSTAGNKAGLIGAGNLRA